MRPSPAASLAAHVASPIAAALICAVALVGCSSSGDPDPDPQDQVWPLTGEPGYPGDDAPTVAMVKVDDSGPGRPQVGLAAADVVVQQLVEGGATRLAALYHSQVDDAAVGPVRSYRTTDIGILAPTDGVLVASGGAPEPTADLADAGVETRTEPGPGFVRDANRQMPYNLQVNVADLLSEVDQRQPPQPLLTFGEPPTTVPSAPAARLDITFPAGGSQWGYQADRGVWARTDVEGRQYDMTSVLAISVQTRPAGYLDPGGAAVPITITEGEGPGLLATGGLTYEVTWRKAAPTDPWQLFAADGTEVPVPPGRSWIALVPVDNGSVATR